MTDNFNMGAILDRMRHWQRVNNNLPGYSKAVGDCIAQIMIELRGRTQVNIDDFCELMIAKNTKLRVDLIQREELARIVFTAFGHDPQQWDDMRAEGAPSPAHDRIKPFFNVADTLISKYGVE